MIQVIIADDHHLVRQGIRALLEKNGDIEVVGEAEDGAEAVAVIETLKPDVAVVDIGMPRLNGTQVIQKVQSLNVETRVVMLTMYSDEALIQQSLRLGAKGFVLKKSVTEELLLAIRAAYRGETYLSSAIAGTMAEVNKVTTARDNCRIYELLSPREVEVLQLVAEGHTNYAIGQQMGVSTKTVEKHRASLMEKLNIHDTAGLVRAAIKGGLIFLDDVPMG